MFPPEFWDALFAMAANVQLIRTNGGKQLNRSMWFLEVSVGSVCWA
jgi:hypothetical protein